MRKLFFFALLLLVSLIDGRSTAPTVAQTNLLGNPGFEGEYYGWGGYNTVQVAHDGWTPWWNPAYRQPEWKPAEVWNYPERVFSGDRSQQWFTSFSRHDAGMYQQVQGVVPGQRYRFTIWAQVWSSEDDFPYESVNPSNPRLRVGIDPSGATNAGPNPPPGSVIWSGEAAMDSVIDQWGAIAVEAVAQNSTITVYMRTNPDFATKHNDIYWDSASLVSVAPPPPTAPPPTDTPLPTNTPLPATNTPPPTETPLATETPAPTETAVPPTDTPSPPPTETETATATAAPPTDEPTAVPATEIAANPTAAPVETAVPPRQEDDATASRTVVVLAVVGLGIIVLLLGAVLFLVARR